MEEMCSFKYLGGVDAFLSASTQRPDEFIKTVEYMCLVWRINLEDIANPKCFYILEKLRQEAPIPVWHDDQQGTAAVTVAGFVNALKIVKKKMSEVRFALIGAGAANICIARMLIKAGVNPKNMIVVDSKDTSSGQNRYQGITQREVGTLPDDERRGAQGGHGRGDCRAGRAHCALQAGPGHDQEGVDQQHG
jgi:malate dehydrogenase (oxaloacetate-decarboxylating)